MKCVIQILAIIGLISFQGNVLADKTYVLTQKELQEVVEFVTTMVMQKTDGKCVLTIPQLIDLATACTGKQSVISPHFEFSQSQQSDMRSTNVNENSALTSASVRSYVTQVMTSIQPRERIEYFLDLLCTYKYRIGACGILTGYVCLLFYCARCNLFLKNVSCWHAWKNGLSTQDLRQVNRSELTQSLLFEIQRKYLQACDPTDNIQPLVRFGIDIQRELHLLQRCERIMSWCGQFRLSYALPISRQQVTLVQEKIDRLFFINDLFVSYVAQENLGRVARARVS